MNFVFQSFRILSRIGVKFKYARGDLNRQKLWTGLVINTTSPTYNNRPTTNVCLTIAFAAAAAATNSFDKVSDQESDLEQSPVDKIKSSLAIALYAIETGNARLAHVQLEEILSFIAYQAQIDPSNKSLLGYRARVLTELGRLDKASDNIKQARDSLKQAVRDYAWSGLLLPARPDRHPLIIELSLELGQLACEAKDFDEAESAFEFCTRSSDAILAESQQGDEQKENIIQASALAGMCHEYFADFLNSQNRVTEALDHYQVADRMCQEACMPLVSSTRLSILANIVLIKVNLGSIDASVAIDLLTSYLASAEKQFHADLHASSQPSADDQLAKSGLLLVILTYHLGRLGQRHSPDLIEKCRDNVLAQLDRHQIDSMDFRREANRLIDAFNKS